jgi:hypothetical protein
MCTWETQLRRVCAHLSGYRYRIYNEAVDAHPSNLYHNQPTRNMSAHSESSVFQALFRAARKEYEDRMRTNLNEHPLATQLQTCHSFESLIALLQQQARTFDEFRGDDKVMVSLSHSMCVSCDIHVCQVVTDGGGSFDALVNLFETITIFLYRLDIYIKIPPTAAMTEIVVKIMVELLSTLALAAKQMGQGRLGEPLLAHSLHS